MAIYSTFFACEAGAIGGVLPEWKAPLAVAAPRAVRDPFTGKSKTVMSDEPQWDEPEKAGWMGRALSALGLRQPALAAPPAMTVVSVPAGDYDGYLESRLPAGVRALPHYCAKGITALEMEALGTALGVSPALQTALYARPPSPATLDRLDAALTSALASLDAERRRTLSERWAEALSGELSPGVAAELLEGVGHVAQAASASALYLLVEP